jgi:2OG-Fe(II) oxygenase superfamily
MRTRLTDDVALREMRTAFRSEPARPVHIKGVLDRGVAEHLTDALETADAWREEFFIEEFLGGTIRVSEDEFIAAPRANRLARFEKLPPEAHGPVGIVAELLSELSAPETLEAFGGLGQAGVEGPNVKIIRYRPGDFFAPHTDGDTGIAILLYLTRPAWLPGHGGSLVYEDETRTVAEFPPVFNSALVFPYRAATTHWVAQLAPSAGLRYTISADYAA